MYIQEQDKLPLPFAPRDLNEWTEDHYILYGLIELAIGNRRILTPEEIEEQQQKKDVDEVMEAAGPNWLEDAKKLLGMDDDPLLAMFQNTGGSEEQELFNEVFTAQDETEEQ